MSALVERVEAAYARVAEVDRPEVWIDLRPRADVLAEAAEITRRIEAGEELPLAGLLAAVKGNIAVAGLPTTAGCPAFAYAPDRDATAVARLRAAGALVLGTTNLDQFATGLVGTRSPYGAVRHATAPDRISGGSSSGSAVAVALGIVDVALGTDTAGSGRVPAALHGLVGIKATRGAVPATGVVPACRSLDCVTVLARDLANARLALLSLAGPDGVDPLARDLPSSWDAVRRGSGDGGPPVVAVPAPEALGPLAPGWSEAFEAAVDRLIRAGARVRRVDIAPLLAAARLLYEGAFVAERYAAVGEFVASHPDDVDPVVGAIIGKAAAPLAHELFADMARLDELGLAARTALAGTDVLLLPTTTRHPTLAEVAADPVGVNSDLGRFTNFANLLDMAALAVPAGEADGLPFGVQLVGPAFSDGLLAGVAELLAESSELQRPGSARPGSVRLASVPLAVVGAHLSGQPLNHQLVDRGGRLVASTTTAPGYRLFALETTPAKPGLVRVADGGAPIEAEVWELPTAGFGEFVASVPAPMTIGKVLLADGSEVSGFLCEPAALDGARDITASGGWLAHLAADAELPAPGR
ncbi:allophanate hydrolase [Promicromonospora panici]|uniref:allophanate hydrolase n=1 Tax=Promicromonospora panici TaxID=2219658 RepID=UPI00101DD564|nr:allophanate hydrolase [Promicromonospora panici]